MKQDTELKIPSTMKKLAIRLITIGTISLIILFAISYMLGNDKHFKSSYLTSFIFFISICIGALGLNLIFHLTRAGWSVVIRRISEILMRNIKYMPLLFLPVLFFVKDLYAWSVHNEEKAPIYKNNQLIKNYSLGRIEINENIDKQWAEHLEHSLHSKHAYLNLPFFIIRAIIFFTILILLSRFLFRESLAQDEDGDPKRTNKLEFISAAGIAFFALTVTFIAFDWIMSTDYAWFSTIFGVIFFSSCIITSLSSIIIFVVFLQSKNYLNKFVNQEHFHDLGKLLYAFMIFFMYVSFSQLLLIWYADVAEETYWFIDRWKNNWHLPSLFIFFGHFIIPLFAFMSRHIKRNKKYLMYMAIWMLIASYIHFYWEIMPNVNYPNPTAFSPSIIDIFIFISLGSIFIGITIINSLDISLLAKKDPRLEESMNFHNY